MKLIFLVIALTFLVSCATKCPKLKPIEKTYLEKMEELDRKWIKSDIDSSVNLNENQKFLYFEFIKCVRDLVKNPKTVRNLMPWQYNLIDEYSSRYCVGTIQHEHGDISELLELLNRRQE